MTEEFVNLRSRKDPKARIKLMGGHFATMNSHVNTYIDMSTVKTRHNNARETAATLAEEYKTGTMVETIVCLKNTEVIGAFMAEHLADTGRISMSALLAKAVEAVLYYGGRVCGICAVFSAVNRAAGMDVRSIFTVSDLPDYKGYAAKDCPLCREGQKLDGIVNTFGLVKF